MPIYIKTKFTPFIMLLTRISAYAFVKGFKLSTCSIVYKESLKIKC